MQWPWVDGFFQKKEKTVFKMVLYSVNFKLGFYPRKPGFTLAGVLAYTSQPPLKLSKNNPLDFVFLAGFTYIRFCFFPCVIARLCSEEHLLRIRPPLKGGALIQGFCKTREPPQQGNINS